MRWTAFYPQQEIEAKGVRLIQWADDGRRRYVVMTYSRDPTHYRGSYGTVDDDEEISILGLLFDSVRDAADHLEVIAGGFR